MPTQWLQERTNGSKNEPGIPPHTAFCGEVHAHGTTRRKIRLPQNARAWLCGPRRDAGRAALDVRRRPGEGVTRTKCLREAVSCVGEGVTGTKLTSPRTQHTYIGADERRNAWFPPLDARW